MWPALTLDDSNWDGNSARGWSVARTLSQRQQVLRREARAALQRLAADRDVMHMMTPAVWERMQRDETLARWSGGFTVLVLIFAPPGSDTMELLNQRRAYLDVRSGDTWDAFFAGYYESGNHDLERQVGADRLPGDGSRSWYFSAKEFDNFRVEVELASEGRWQYSGGTDLVLVNALVPAHGAPAIDWESVQSGSLTERMDGVITATLAEVVEKISRDLERGLEDPHYGVASVVANAKQPARTDSTSKKVMIGASGSIVAALVKAKLGF